MTPRRVDPRVELDTLEAMDLVMQRAYRALSFRSSIDRFVAVQPDGLVVVEHDGAVVGTGCCVAYPEGAFGWVGLVATAPGFERRGIATAVTEILAEILAEHGCAAVLDASASGGPLYERLGFLDHGLTTVMGFPSAEFEAHPAEECGPLTENDFDDVVAFDAARFGAPRRAMLAKVIDQQPGRAMLLRRRRDVVGYLVAQDTTLAPVVADDGDALRALIIAAMRLDWAVRPRVNVPPESCHLATLRRLGFEPQRELRHMRRGIDILPGRRQTIAAQVSLGEG